MNEYEIYTHVLKSIENPRMEKRINTLAKRKCRYDPIKDADRISALKFEYLALCVKFFSVRGEGFSGPYDDTLFDLLEEAWDRYEAGQGEIVHYIRFVYTRRITTAGNAEKKYWSSLTGYPDEEADGDNLGISEAKNRLLISESARQTALSSEDDFAGEVRRTSAVFLEAVSLVTSMLDHVEDEVYHTPTTKLYVRMCFAEAFTRTVKREAAAGTAQLLYGKHEREAFRATELPFLDTFMVEVCRTVRALWNSGLREGCGEMFKIDDKGNVVVNEGWKLPNQVFLDYLLEAKDKEVSSAMVSQQRAKFRNMFSPLVEKVAQQRAGLDEG